MARKHGIMNFYVPDSERDTIELFKRVCEKKQEKINDILIGYIKKYLAQNKDVADTVRSTMSVEAYKENIVTHKGTDRNLVDAVSNLTDVVVGLKKEIEQMKKAKK